ncbi:kinase-like domain-containing protein [Crucibulum laeve]|uniref:Kinase-like domain-containing protein n=1 Tax=Crucibulum laeve TaxID=68775 RepID=A0A5C3LFP7_9AGAR|nr:kinase-like domain-containing protein [Crucibulum laeve]
MKRYYELLATLNGSRYDKLYNVLDLLSNDLRLEVLRIISRNASSSDYQHLLNKVLNFLITRQIEALPNHSNISPLREEVVPYTGGRVTGTMVEITIALASGGWHSQGNVMDYPVQHPEGGVALRLKLILQLANAIKFLHASNRIHGNIHPGNMSVDEQGNAKLINFGVYTIIQKVFPQVPLMECNWYKSQEVNEMDEITILTPDMDVYAFALSIYTIFGGLVPSSYLPKAIADGHANLAQPPSMPNKLWSALQICWAPASDTSIDTILDVLMTMI